MGNPSSLNEILQLSAGNAAVFQKLALAARRFALQTPIIPEWIPVHAVNEVDFEAIARQSMWSYFDFKSLRPSQGFWNENLSLVDVRDLLVAILNDLASAGDWPSLNEIKLIQVKNGQWAELELAHATTGSKIVRFHPVARPGSETVSLTMSEIKAIAKVL